MIGTAELLVQLERWFWCCYFGDQGGDGRELYRAAREYFLNESEATPPVYVVTGHPRSGTTMAMQIAEAGGLPVVRSSRRDQRMAMLHNDEHYSMNADGLYEPPGRIVMHPAFPRMYAGHAVKLVVPMVRGRLAVGVPYRVLVMRRDAEEIRQSLEAALGVCVPADAIEQEVQEAIAVLRARRDVVSLVELWYRDVLADPAGAIARLIDAGWPLQAAAAAAAVQPSRARFTREALCQ